MKRTYCDLCGREIIGDIVAQDYTISHEVYIHHTGEKRNMKVTAKCRYDRRDSDDKAEVCEKCFAKMLVDENGCLYDTK